MDKIIVTGGCGFIGSEFVRQFYKKYDIHVVDSLTYAANKSNIQGCDITLHQEDIRDLDAMGKVFEKVNPIYVINFAASSHVDNSIKDDLPFIETNVYGVGILLHLSKKFGVKRFLQVSTDEVYGQKTEGRSMEDDRFNPRNPYSATKAAAEHLVYSYHITHKLDTVISRGSNTFGPRQYPEKLIPVALKKLFKKEKIPVYGQGLQIRDWLYVKDHAAAIEKILLSGKKGEAYNISGNKELKNINLVKRLIEEANKQFKLGLSEKNNIEFVGDRPGHDFRYSLDNKKLKQLGFQSGDNFDRGIEKTVNWYHDNLDFLNK